jgi:hypothetical protein
MSTHIPVDTLYYANVVTKDARQLARNYAEFYGIHTWQVVHHTDARLTNATVFGRVDPVRRGGEAGGALQSPGLFTFITATGRSENGGVEFRLVQPGPPIGALDTFNEFLITRGQAIHSLFLSVMDQQDLAELQQWLATQGVRVAQSYTLDDAADFYYLDTRKALGGFFIQVVVPRRPDWQEAIRADETWDFAGQIERPRGVEAAQRVTGITHFGVVVRDLNERMEAYARLFGQPSWTGRYWRSEPGWLTDTTYWTEPVVHGWINGRGNIGTTPLGVPFGFEVVQPAHGPQHYKQDFLDRVGPGIHHVDLVIPFEQMWECEEFNRWLERIGMPNCMTGTHNRLYHYQDAFEKLGYVIEVHPPRRLDFPMPPSYTFDFTAQVGSEPSAVGSR